MKTMFDIGYLTISGKTYEWGVMHFKDKCPWNINFGHVAFVGVIADGKRNYFDYWSWGRYPKDHIVTDIIKALIERFEWEEER